MLRGEGTTALRPRKRWGWSGAGGSAASDVDQLFNMTGDGELWAGGQNLCGLLWGIISFPIHLSLHPVPAEARNLLNQAFLIY